MDKETPDTPPDASDKAVSSSIRPAGSMARSADDGAGEPPRRGLFTMTFPLNQQPHHGQQPATSTGGGPEFTKPTPSPSTALTGGAVGTSSSAIGGEGGGDETDAIVEDLSALNLQSTEDYFLIGGDSQKTTGVIKLTIPNLSTLRQKVTTSFHQIANLPWRLAAKTECTKRTSNVKFFSVYIDCNPESESTLWSCDAVVEFRLLSQQAHKSTSGPSVGGVGDAGPTGADFTRQFSNKFSYNSNNWGFPSFMEWAEITNPERGFMRSDRVLLEAHITVQKVVGVRRNPTYDFTQPMPSISDGVVLIDGVRVHINKAYLALYSPVFHAMFFSRFSERSMAEVPVEDVMLDEFTELLAVVYPSHKRVTQENVEFLLELADKFQLQYVVDKCEKFLVKSDEVALVTKLVWADQYCLARLQDVCIRQLRQAGDIKQLKQTEEYRQLSDTTKAALLEKVLKLLP